MGSGMGMPAEQVYNVPWRVRLPELPPVAAGLVLPVVGGRGEEIEYAYFARVVALCRAMRLHGNC